MSAFHDQKRDHIKAHLIGGGLASMAAATYLLRDGGLEGENITIYEAADEFGGALGLAGSAQSGFIYPGGRVFEHQYRCTREFFDLIPSGVEPNRTIWQDIEFFNDHYSWINKCRLVDGDGHIVDTSRLGLSFRHKLQLARTFLTPERLLDGKEIQDLMSPSFFKTNFWHIWSSIMAFVPEHSAIEFRRYLMRFFHLLPQLSTMTFILRTRYHQKQSLVDPITTWLDCKGVRRRTGVFVDDIALSQIKDGLTATSLHLLKEDGEERMDIGPGDVVLVTNGSQLAGMTLGSMHAKPPPPSDESAWALWRKLSRRHAGLGDPSAFTDHTDHSTWISFTGHTKSKTLMKLLEEKTQREAGRSGLITFRDSNWLMTFTRFHDPNLIGQAEDEHTLWGYGIYPERTGNLVGKPMTDCSGADILEELLGHLHMTDHLEEVSRDTNILPCHLPYASSVCVRRRIADRPRVVPDRMTNLAFIGQFCEQPGDVIFTMEYSVRSARQAVGQLLGTGNPPPPVYKGFLDPATVFKVLRASFR